MEERAWRVHGRVQGVFFRASTQQQARRLSLDGYAKNLPDGSVEVAARGEADQLDALARWLAEGPPQAEVSGVDRATASEPIGRGFGTR